MPPPRKSAGKGRTRLSLKQAVAELRENEERFRILFAEAPIAYHEINSQGIIQRVNRSECELLGFTAEEMLGRPASDFVAPEERETSREAVRLKIEGTLPLTPFRREFTRRDGTRLTLEIREKPIHDSQGRICGLRSALLDVTAQRRAEEALESRVAARTAELERSNQRLELQYASSRALTEAPDVQTAAVRVLEALCCYLRLEGGGFWRQEGETIGSLATWGRPPAPLVPGEGVAGLAWSRRQPVAICGDSGCGVAFPVMAGDRLHGVMAAFGPTCHDRDPELLEALRLLGRQMGDFIERKEAEQALRHSQRQFATFMEHLPGIAFIKDEQRRYVYVSAAIERFLDLPPAAALGRTDDELFPSEAALISRETDGYVLRTGKPTESLQELLYAAKTTQWLIYKFPILDGNAVRVGGVAVDVTERKHLEDQLRHAQRMEAMGRLAGGVAHDFNNILTIIGGYGRMVLEQLPKGENAHSTLQTMLDATDRATVLTGQLLAFSRRQVAQPKLLDLNQVVAGVEQMLRRVIGEHIELRTVLDPGILPIKADPGHVEQILMNLAVNARDAMPEGGSLTIETAGGNGGVRLSVIDSGVGMNEEVKNRAFEPFFTTKGRGKGTGLGLSMVYGIVRQHNGDIRLESQPGAGTRFDILFPASAPQAEAAPAPARRRTTGKGNETVLLVEDESAVRQLARDVLQAGGYQVLEAGDGLEALKVAETSSQRIHLLLTDLVMPHMGGRELANEIRKRWSGIQILFMSGYTDDVIHADVARAANFLPKPFTPEALAQKVRETLDAAGYKLGA